MSLEELTPFWAERCARFRAIHPYFPGEWARVGPHSLCCWR